MDAWTMEDTQTMLSLLGVAMEVNFAGYFASHFGYWTSADAADEEQEETRDEHTTFPISIGCLQDLQEDEAHLLDNEEASETTCTNNIDPSTAPTIMTVSRTVHPAAAGVAEDASSKGSGNKELRIHTGQMECRLNSNYTVELLGESRVRMLETEAVEYHGPLKLDEATIRDLGSRLTLNVVENEYLNLEIQCLLLNQKQEKFRAQEKMQHLENARMKIRYLKRKVMSTQLQAMKRIELLEKRIEAMHEEDGRNGAEIRRKLRRLGELEDEAGQLRRRNAILATRSTELAQRLESAQKSMSTFLENQKESMEEMNQLREANGELLKKIEQLQADRFADFEELVKLRRFNACLRDESRNWRTTITRAQEETTAGKDPRKGFKQNLEQEQEQEEEEEDRHHNMCETEYAYSSSGARPKNTISFEEQEKYSSQGSSDNIRYLDTPPPSSRKTSSLLKTKFFDNLKKLVAKRSGNRTNNSNKDSASTDKTPSSTFVTSETRSSSVSTFSSDELGRRRSSSGSIFSSCPTAENTTRGTEADDADDKWKKNSAWIRTSFGPAPAAAATRPRQRAILQDDRRVQRCKSDLGAVTKTRRGCPQEIAACMHIGLI